MRGTDSQKRKQKMNEKNREQPLWLKYLTPETIMACILNSKRIFRRRMKRNPNLITMDKPLIDALKTRYRIGKNLLGMTLCSSDNQHYNGNCIRSCAVCAKRMKIEGRTGDLLEHWGLSYNLKVVCWSDFGGFFWNADGKIYKGSTHKGLYHSLKLADLIEKRINTNIKNDPDRARIMTSPLQEIHQKIPSVIRFSYPKGWNTVKPLTQIPRPGTRK